MRVSETPAAPAGPVPSGLLLLADARLPAGGHAYSGGVEAVADRGLLRDPDDLDRYLEGRVRTSGRVVATAAAAACRLAREGSPVAWPPWDAAVSARTPSAALRDASRVQGGALLRIARRVWPSRVLGAMAGPGRPHHPLVLGAATAAAGGGPADAASLSLHHLVGGACSAAVRLLGLDPLEAAAVQAHVLARRPEVAYDAWQVAEDAVARDDPDLLPMTGAPLPEVLGELHAHAEVTLFAS